MDSSFNVGYHAKNKFARVLRIDLNLRESCLKDPKDLVGKSLADALHAFKIYYDRRKAFGT